MNNLKIHILLVLISSNIFSQGFVSKAININNLGGNYSFKDVKTLKTIENKEISGSFYLFKSWDNKSIIKTFSDKTYKLNNLNFDIDKGEFLSEISKDSVYVFPRLKEVMIKSSKFININNKYYETLIEGKQITLLKKYYGKLQPALINKMTNQEMRKSKYLKKEKYFILYKSSRKELKLNKTNILNSIKEKKKEIASYAEENELSYKKEKDVIKIFNYYNSL